MARGREKSAFGEIRALRCRARFPELHLHTPPITYVADRGHDQRIDAIGDRTQADFYREFGAIIPRRSDGACNDGENPASAPSRSCFPNRVDATYGPPDRSVITSNCAIVLLCKINGE
jgi:hypothetical protein